MVAVFIEWKISLAQCSAMRRRDYVPVDIVRLPG
jgi:hypothetical protein